jgi:multiple sugar transport system permease protein
MRNKRLLICAVKAAALAAILIWSLGPILFMLISSLKPSIDIFATPPHFFFTPTLEHYVSLLTKWGDFFLGLGHSVIVTAGTTILTILASTLAGYAYSRFRGPAMTGSATFLIAIRLIPPIVITLPLFPAVNFLKLNDTLGLLIVLYATFYVSLGSLLMRTFIDQIPRELDEAAMLDGADSFNLLLRVITPLAKPGILAVSVFVIVFAWNEYLFAFIFTSTRAKTAPLVISDMLASFDQIDWGVLFAASTIQLIPILAFVLLMQRHLVAGLSAGAIKG